MHNPSFDCAFFDKDKLNLPQLDAPHGVRPYSFIPFGHPPVRTWEASETSISTATTPRQVDWVQQKMDPFQPDEFSFIEEKDNQFI